jgi:hypothetical protein
MGKKFTLPELYAKVWYDSQTGLFHTRVKTTRSNAGDVITKLRPDGYCRVSVFGERLLAHHLAWFYVNGVWPETDIDHVDGNPSNNVFLNLRMIERNENLQNIRKVRKNSITGVNNVSWNSARKKFVVQLSHMGENKFGGHFDTIDDAIGALKQLKSEWHPYSPIIEKG